MSADSGEDLTTGGAATVGAPRARGFSAAWRHPAVLAALAALVLLGWQWVEMRARIGDLQQELAGRLAEGDASARESRALAKQSQEAVAALQVKVGVLEARLGESQSQQLALEAMVQELTRSRDERLLAEVEQALNAAAQQLQLAGNVPVALIALQSADARLAASGRGQFLPLRKVIGRDIDRLKALPLADLPGLALKLDAVAGAIDTLPLAFDAKPRVEAPRAARPPLASGGFWQGLAGDLWGELKGLVRIERMERPDPVLLSPSHAFFLRENLKLRLVNARLALLQRDGRAFHQDVRQAQAWIEQYFDTRARPTQAALATLRPLAGADIAVELPALNESLAALRNFKIAREGLALRGER